MTSYNVTINGVSDGLTESGWLMDYADRVEGTPNLLVSKTCVEDLAADFIEDFFSEMADAFVQSLHFNDLTISDTSPLEPLPVSMSDEEDEEDEEDDYTIWPVKTAWTGRTRLRVDDPQFTGLAENLVKYIAECLSNENQDTTMTVTSFEPEGETGDATR
jgi:hypothetical protein